jgi:hypothetical protein
MGLPKVFLTVYACFCTIRYFYKKYEALGSKMFDSHLAAQLLYRKFFCHCVRDYNYVFTLLTSHCKQLALHSNIIHSFQSPSVIQCL